MRQHECYHGFNPILTGMLTNLKELYHVFILLKKAKKLIMIDLNNNNFLS